MDPTCGLVDKFCDLVLNLTWEQLRYLIYYHRNIDQLNVQLMDLTLERGSMQHQIDEANNNVEQIEEKVLHWLGEVDELLEQVQKFYEEESQAKTECSMTSCANPWLRYKLSKRAKAMTEEVAKIYAKRNFDRISYRVPLPSVVELTNREGNKGIDSRVSIMNQILEELRNPGVNMIGLCGLGGVGKTTIAIEVAKNQKIFEKVIMATISQELNIENIQGQIAEKLGMQLNERTEEVKASRLYERLKQEKNMLLILDDLWEELDLGKIGIPFVSVENYSKKNEGCKILLTSRNKTLLSDLMKCQKIVEVGVLSKNEALELFKKIAELSTDSSSPELISIATDIVQKCGGLPLAIATAAKALRKKDINEWKDALARLNNPFRRNNTLTREVDTILKWSFDCLSSSEYKQIFLLSAMLSHDPSIEDLLMYSVGLDILDGIESMEDARVGVSAIVSKLKSLNLFLDSFSSHHFTMHDVFRDVALPIASNELHAFIRRGLKEWPDENVLQGCKGICLQESDISDLPEELHCPRLQFFLINSTKRDLNIPSMFFKSSKELKVLAFTNVHFSSLLSLIFLHKLKVLCLHSCLLDDIIGVRSLKNLKVLSFAYSEIQQLPIELAELTSLQMLNLSHCSNLKEIPPKLLSSLKRLEVLHMGNSFHQWKVEGYSEANENASLDELTDLPISSLDIHIPKISMLPENLFLDMNLKRYKISIGKHWEWQDNNETSKILKLKLLSSTHLKGGVRKLLEGVEDLCLNGCNAQENVLHSHEGRGFPHLRNLQMDGNYGIRSNGFHSAHEAATKNVSNKTFKSLFNSKVLLPKLEILELSNILNRLISLIWDYQLSHNSFNNLKVLIVKRCGFVKLVPLHVLKSLNNLEELDVKDCDMLEIVFDFEDLNDYYKEMESSSVVVPLKKLKLRNLPKLKNVWSNNCQGNVSFPSLRSIDVSECESLTSIFPASIAKGMLCDLEEFQIHHCGVDVIVAKDQVSESVAAAFRFPRLTSLELRCLPNLRNFYPQKHTLEWPQLNQLSIQCCDELEIFEKEALRSSAIYEEENMLDSKYPLLSHDKVIGNLERLTLQGKEVEKIGNGEFLMDHFPKLKQLLLSLAKKPTFPYLRFWGSSQLEILGIEGFVEEWVTFPYTLLERFPKLNELHVENCSFREIFPSHAPSSTSFHNLTVLKVSQCHQLVYLMTISTAKSLVNLKTLEIHDCEKLEEIIRKEPNEDIEVGITLFNIEDRAINTRCTNIPISLFSHNKVLLPKLEKLELSSLLNSLISLIWDDQLLHNSFNNLKTLILGRCDFVKAVPLSVLKSLNNLEKLEVSGCHKLEMVFGFENLNDYHKEMESSSSVVVPLSLKHLEVNWCRGLTTLMTSSAVPSLVHITHLSISYCDQIEEIITKQEGEDDDDREIIFNNMKFLELDNLPRLKRFCGYNYTFRFPLLEHVTITECPRLTMFCPGAIHAPRLQSVRVNKYDARKDIWITDLNNTIQHLFTFEEVISTTYSMAINAKNITGIVDVFPKVGSLYVESFTDEGVTFPYGSLEKFPKLTWLNVEHCSFEEIFPSQDQIIDFMGKISPLEGLFIAYMDKLKSIWKDDSQLPPIHQNLAYLQVKSCCSLANLAPSSASFQYLEGLYVSGCHQLIHLVTTSTAKSLVSLERLEINDCKRMEEIVMNDTNEDVQAEITFNELCEIKLTDMPSLKVFSSQSHTFEFPELKEIEISGCPEMKKFCRGVLKTPKLSKVKIEEHGMEWKDEEDLNKTMEGLSSAKDNINI